MPEEEIRSRTVEAHDDQVAGHAEGGEQHQAGDRLAAAGRQRDAEERERRASPAQLAGKAREPVRGDRQPVARRLEPPPLPESAPGDDREETVEGLRVAPVERRLEPRAPGQVGVGQQADREGRRSRAEILTPAQHSRIDHEGEDAERQREDRHVGVIRRTQTADQGDEGEIPPRPVALPAHR